MAGKDLEHWAKEYWQWLMTQPSTINNGECYVGHSSNNSIIFLMSSIPNIYDGQCEISREPILVPLLISECDKSLGEKRLLSGMIKDFWNCAIDANNGTVSWHVSLDNKDLLNKESNVELIHPDLAKTIEVRNSTFFDITIPEANRYDIPKDEIGTFPAVVGGWYLVLKPLPPGEHFLSYRVDRVAGEGESMTSEHGSVSYKLTVR